MQTGTLGAGVPVRVSRSACCWTEETVRGGADTRQPGREAGGRGGGGREGRSICPWKIPIWSLSLRPDCILHLSSSSWSLRTFVSLLRSCQ